MSSDSTTPNLVAPTDGMVIDKDTTFAPGIYLLPSGIRITADNVTLDANGATLIGTDRQNVGIAIEGHAGVTVKNARLTTYHTGIRAKDCTGLTLEGNVVRDTEEVDHDTIFLDIWRTAEESYGGGIMLWNCEDSLIAENDLQHQMNGLLTYSCRRLTVRKNVASYNSGYGIHLRGTCDSLFESNWADYCCRFEPRGNAIGESLPEKTDFRHGHMGADATGFLIIHASCRNVFRHNLARMGGDGFFLAGRAEDGSLVDCNDNLFEENDASLSPNNAFEATFSSRNVFRNNYADRSNYGFWLALSSDCIVEGNRMVMNRQAGVAAENSRGLTIRKNTFQANGHGVLIWSRKAEADLRDFPDRVPARDGVIEENIFTRNGRAIRIAGDQDHGIRPAPEAQRGGEAGRPHGHIIRKNEIQDNRIGIDLANTNRTHIEANILNGNAEANLRENDTRDTKAVNNLGSAGAYL